MGQKQKTEKKERERAKVAVITMAKLRMAHASMHGARKHAWRTQARMPHASMHGTRKHAWRTQARVAHASTHGARANTPGLGVGPDSRTLALKSRKTPDNLLFLVQACLRAPPVVADEAKLAIVFTYFSLFSFFSAFYCSPTSRNLPCVKICFPQYFGIT